MFQHIIVPVDGSDRSWTAARVGAVIAESCAADLQVVHVSADNHACERDRAELALGLEARPNLPNDTPIVTLVPPTSDDTVGTTIATYAEAISGAMIVMASTGRGRSAAVLGSVADDILRTMFGPIIVVGPHVDDLESLSGDIVVPVDGSKFSETMLPIAASWGIALGSTPWVVEVLEEPVPVSSDVYESSYACRLATDLQRDTHHETEFEVLHDGHPGSAIADFATRAGASLIMMSTHGRSGMRRLAAGSVASTVVRTATSPVVLYRPPVFAVA